MAVHSLTRSFPFLTLLFLICSFFTFNMAFKDLKEVFNEAVCSSNEFTFDLFKVISDKNKNIFFSPASISIALAMTYVGCRGNTATQLAKAMHWEESRDVLNKDMSKFLEILNNVGQTSVNTMNLANRFWFQQDFAILDSFRNTLMEMYQSTASEADFITKTEETRLEINNWVEQNTRGKIRDLIAKNILKSTTRLVLVNAIYFKGQWETEFNEENTRPGQFHVTKNDIKKIPMMSREGYYYYGVNKELGAQILELPYVGNQLSMVIVLPQDIEGLEQVENKINMKNLTLALCLLKNITVHVSIPKFKLTSQFELSETLPKLGVKDLFQLADLSGISGRKDLTVSNVIHKAFVEVNENGTEAAAATAVVMIEAAIVKPTFVANHPFLFFIREKSTGAILFMGRLQNPSE